MSRPVLIAWGVAAVLLLVVIAEYFLFSQAHERGLARITAEYEEKLQAARGEARKEIEAVKAEVDARVQKLVSDAAATEQALQVELDYQRLPELPIKTVLRPPERDGTRVLYVENESRDLFRCKLHLQRPGTDAERTLDFELQARAYRDLAAIDDWLLQAGDVLEFRKDGHKPRRLEVQ